MNNNNHPITPPPELVDQWSRTALSADWLGSHELRWLATQAARWGADQELEACCKWTRHRGLDLDECLRVSRRRKPPSLTPTTTTETTND